MDHDGNASSQTHARRIQESGALHSSKSRLMKLPTTLGYQAATDKKIINLFDVFLRSKEHPTTPKPPPE